MFRTITAAATATMLLSGSALAMCCGGQGQNAQQGAQGMQCSKMDMSKVAGTNQSTPPGDHSGMNTGAEGDKQKTAGCCCGGACCGGEKKPS